MVRLALRQAVEIPSYKRGAENFSELTGVALSASALQRMAIEYGGALVRAEAAEAAAMMQVPKAEEAVVWRELPEPDSEVMAVSADGVMIHLLDEGWKEVKVMSVSAVQAPAGSPDDGPRLTQHSYRAGLWDAQTFTAHYWAESYRRGLEKAKHVVCISDGAAWIWAMAFLCFARRIEILDWWHVVQYLWKIVGETFTATSPEALAWMQAQKARLAQSQLRLLFHHIRQLYPRHRPLPEPVRQAVAYLWHNRQRLDYDAYRHAGLPIGSGTVESAAKTLVQQRLKQAGMRWSRTGAHALLALRARLLSNRWHDLPI